MKEISMISQQFIARLENKIAELQKEQENPVSTNSDKIQSKSNTEEEEDYKGKLDNQKNLNYKQRQVIQI